MTEKEIENICHKVSEQAFCESIELLLDKIKKSTIKCKSEKMDTYEFTADLYISLFEVLTTHNEKVLIKTLNEILKVSQ